MKVTWVKKKHKLDDFFLMTAGKSYFYSHIGNQVEIQLHFKD